MSKDEVKPDADSNHSAREDRQNRAPQPSRSNFSNRQLQPDAKTPLSIKNL
jgi:hypothetical protein